MGWGSRSAGAVGLWLALGSAQAAPAIGDGGSKGHVQEDIKSRALARASIPFERYQLDNGLEVILHQDRRVPLVAVNLWYHVGSGDEPPGRTGFAHLFEHMMFQGSKHVGADRHFQTLQEVGATGVNGTTNRDRTNYYETVPAHQLETALWLESDRMGYLLPLLTEESLANQRAVVRNERRQRYDNVPYGRERFAVAAALYPEGHPYRYLTIGRHEDLEGASLADVRDFFQRWYTPSNATLALAGDFELAEARALIDKWFGAFPALPSPRSGAEAAAPPRLQQTVRRELSDPFARLERVHYAWHAPPVLSEDAVALGALARILDDSGWGRLHRRLVVDEALARQVSVFHDGAARGGSFDIVVTLRPGSARAEVETALREELDLLTREPVRGAELRRVILGVESSLVWGLERLSSRADRLQYYNHYTGDPGHVTGYLERLHALTPARLQQVVVRWLGAPRVEIITVPGGGS